MRDSYRDVIIRDGFVVGETLNYQNSPKEIAEYEKAQKYKQQYARRKEKMERKRWEEAVEKYGTKVCPVCKEVVINDHWEEGRLFCWDCKFYITSEVQRDLSAEEQHYFYLDDNPLNKTPSNLYVLRYEDKNQIQNMLREQKVLLGYFTDQKPEESWSTCAKRLSLMWLKEHGLERESMDDLRGKLLKAYDKLQEKLNKKQEDKDE